MVCRHSLFSLHILRNCVKWSLLTTTLPSKFNQPRVPCCLYILTLVESLVCNTIVRLQQKLCYLTKVHVHVQYFTSWIGFPFELECWRKYFNIEAEQSCFNEELDFYQEMTRIRWCCNAPSTWKKTVTHLRHWPFSLMELNMHVECCQVYVEFFFELKDHCVFLVQLLLCNWVCV